MTSPISSLVTSTSMGSEPESSCVLKKMGAILPPRVTPPKRLLGDRKSTRLNSSHLVISYAVFCLKKKKILRALRRIRLHRRVGGTARPHLQQRHFMAADA